MSSLITVVLDITVSLYRFFLLPNCVQRYASTVKSFVFFSTLHGVVQVYYKC